MSGFSDLVSASAESVISENLRLREGVSWMIGWTVLDGDGEPISFTGGTASFIVKAEIGGPTLVTGTTTLTEGRQILLGEGSVIVSCTPQGSTLVLTPSGEDFRGVYELRVSKDGQTVSLVSGKITVFRGV